MTNQKLVAEFHRAFNLVAHDRPTLPSWPLAQLRQALIEEEVRELAVAGAREKLAEVADALADILYVAYGTALTYGIDLDACLAEVHRSNMSKLGADGNPILRPDGKVLKGPNYSPPDLVAIVGGPR